MNRTATLAAAAVLVLAGCGNDDDDDLESLVPAAADSPAPVVSAGDGPSQTLGNGKVWTYVTSSAGQPVEVGVRFSAAALEGLASDTHGDLHPVGMVLSFPTNVATGVLDHVELYWNPQGHEPPGVWDKPHFDYHFYLTDEAAVKEIVPTAPDFATKAANIPDAKYIAADFVAPPGTAVDNTIPGMGLHWLDGTEPPVPGQYTFTETMIHGSYDGAVTFIEPMITREWLLTKPTLNEAIKQPQAYQRTGLWPTTYSVRFDSATNEYSVALGGFVQRASS
ncbi:DUF5602 domain-containing protein [Sporichthya polymorpha]|uniref:DUF5602 domain-containing protein n=1 Tax=Sporichthya polymorpha TaxID=35751 RepID=UPI00036EAA43|nr:DUF5602 domain-containing protein [Sporichthya polymorpha]